MEMCGTDTRAVLYSAWPHASPAKSAQNTNLGNSEHFHLYRNISNPGEALAPGRKEEILFVDKSQIKHICRPAVFPTDPNL